ncbi:MAG: nuclear transport factor 2 family protein [Pseudomonadales bacterium]
MERAFNLMVARHAIEEVIFSYAEAIDSGRVEDLISLLAECDLTLPDGGMLSGGAAIAARYRDLIIFYDDDGKALPQGTRGGTPRTRHVITNLRYTFSSDARSAEVSSYLTVYQNLDGANSIVAGGRYVDRFELTIGGWRMKAKEIFIEQGGDMSRHTHGS